MYRWLVFLHILGAFGFILAHGGSASAAFRAKHEQSLDGLHAVLELSNSSFNMMYVSLLLMLVAGVITGFVGHWWRSGWIWVALALLLVTAVAMFFLASGYFNKLRMASGLPWFDARGGHEAVDPAPQPQIAELQRAGQPVLTTVLGLLPLASILWLMIFKPF